MQKMEEERTRIKERKEDLELCALTILFIVGSD